MFTWQKHYSGIEIAEPVARRSLSLYLQREYGRMRMVRLCVWHCMVGLFIGHGNYLGYGALFEVFTSNIHFGVLRRAQWGIKYSGSSRDPYHSYTLFCGFVAIGSTTDKWLKHWVREYEARKYVMPDFDDVPF